MPEEILTSPLGWGALIAAIAGIIKIIGDIINKVGPGLVEKWAAAKLEAVKAEADAQRKAVEYQNTREAAERVQLMDTFGRVFELVREDKEIDREEREKDRETAEKQRQQMREFTEAIHELATSVTIGTERITNAMSQNSDKLRILAQHTAKLSDDIQDLKRHRNGSRADD